jgi:hypothetical protein
MDMVYVYVGQSAIAKAKKAERTRAERARKEEVKTATSNTPSFPYQVLKDSS